MHVLDANEIFWMTFYTADRIIEEGWRNGPDAIALYIKLLKQSRIQQTNQTYTLNSFLREWLWRWDDRLRNAKNVLKKLWLVDDVNLQDDKWKITGHYLRVNYLIDEQRIRNAGITYNLSTTGFHQETVASSSGWTDTNALSTQYINALSTQYINIYQNYYWASKWIDEKKCEKIINAKLEQGITLDDLYKSMVLYNCDCRIKQDYKYVKKLETWLTEFRPSTEEQLDEQLYSVLLAYKNKKKSDEKFWKSKPSITLWNDLKQTFGEEKVKSMRKQLNTINLTFN